MRFVDEENKEYVIKKSQIVAVRKAEHYGYREEFFENFVVTKRWRWPWSRAEVVKEECTKCVRANLPAIQVWIHGHNYAFLAVFKQEEEMESFFKECAEELEKND